jgi:acetylornithine deacetylase/succinyl-diaminopimelate desuccinylase-like protein
MDIWSTQKVPVWLRLNAIDVSGHGSSPRATTSVLRIVEALNRIKENPFEPRIIPAVDAYFSGLAVSMDDDWAQAYADMGRAITDPEFLPALQDFRPGHHALTRDICSITRMGGSSKINTIPPEAWAELDCRMPHLTKHIIVMMYINAKKPSIKYPFTLLSLSLAT